MMENRAHQGDENSSQPFATKPAKPYQLHTASSDGEETMFSSSARPSTHLKDNESDVEKGMPNGDGIDKSAATEKTEVNKATQSPPVMTNEKDKDPNLVGWDGMLA